MTFFATIKSFQRLYGKNIRKLTQLFGKEFADWFNIVRRVLLRVAKNISRPYSPKVKKCFTKSVRVLTTFLWEQKDWNVSSFVLILQQIDPQLSTNLFQILHGVVNHPEFSDYFESSKEYLLEGVKIMTNAQGKSANVYCTLRVYDAFVGMVNYWVIPVPRPVFSIPFLRDRLPLCVLDYKLAHITPSKKLQTVCISAHFRFIVLKIFSNQGTTPISKQMEQVFLKCF